MEDQPRDQDLTAGLLMSHEYFRRQLLNDRMLMLRCRFTHRYLDLIRRLAAIRLTAIENRPELDCSHKKAVKKMGIVLGELADLWDKRQYEKLVDLASLQFLSPGMMFEALYIDLLKCLSVVMLGKEENGLFSIKECFEDSMPPRINSIEDIALWTICGHVLCSALLLTNDFATSLQHISTIDQYSPMLQNSSNQELSLLHSETIYLKTLALSRELPDSNLQAQKIDLTHPQAPTPSIMVNKRSSIDSQTIRSSIADMYMDHREMSTRRDCTDSERIVSLVQMCQLRPKLKLKNAESIQSLTGRICQALKSIVKRFNRG